MTEKCLENIDYQVTTLFAQKMEHIRLLSPSDQNHEKHGKKKRRNVSKWKQNVRKRCGDDGKKFLSSRNILKPQLSEPNEVQ